MHCSCLQPLPVTLEAVLIVACYTAPVHPTASMSLICSDHQRLRPDRSGRAVHSQHAPYVASSVPLCMINVHLDSGCTSSTDNREQHAAVWPVPLNHAQHGTKALAEYVAVTDSAAVSSTAGGPRSVAAREAHQAAALPQSRPRSLPAAHAASSLELHHASRSDCPSFKVAVAAVATPTR